MLSFTMWWENLKSRLENLNARFPKASFETHSAYGAAQIMVQNSVQIETISSWKVPLVGDVPSNPSAVVNLTSAITKAEKSFGSQMTLHPPSEESYIPQVTSARDALFALVYYHHLVAFSDVSSTTGFIQNGSAGYIGLEKRKPIYAEHARLLKADIDRYLGENENLNALVEIDPVFQSLLMADSPETKFTLFSQFVLASPSLTLEDKIGQLSVRQLQNERENTTSEEVLRAQLSRNLVETASILEYVQACKRVLGWVQMSVKEMLREDDRPKVEDMRRVKELNPSLVKMISSYVSQSIGSPDVEWDNGALCAALEDLLNQQIARLNPTEERPMVTVASSPNPTLEHRSSLDSVVPVVLSDIENSTRSTGETQSLLIGSTDVAACSDQALTLLIAKTKLLAELMTTNLEAYVKTYSVTKFRRIFHYCCQADFLRNYFLPGEWKFAYEAQKLLGLVRSFKSGLEKSMPAEPAVNELKNQFEETVQAAILQSKHGFFIRDKSKKAQQDLYHAIEKARNQSNGG